MAEADVSAISCTRPMRLPSKGIDKALDAVLGRSTDDDVCLLRDALVTLSETVFGGDDRIAKVNQ
jgi:hypothetical protein